MSEENWHYTKEDYETISVLRDSIPRGGKLVEAYETATEIIVCGDPPARPEGTPEEDWHNCDAMGCTTVSHVIYRFRKHMMNDLDCCPKCGPGVSFKTDPSTFKRCDECGSLF